MKTYLLGACAAAVLALTAACGNDDAAGSAPAPTPHSTAGTATDDTQHGEHGEHSGHNDADIAFAQGMIPHHEQAVVMSKLALERSSDPAVTDLATRIEGAQAPEMKQMMDLLNTWGAPVAPSGDHEHGTEHGDSGMLTEEQLQELQQAAGAEFDEMWLRLMIDHHKGAVTMAEAELWDGNDALAKALAQSIIDAQQQEIDEMTTLLQR